MLIRYPSKCSSGKPNPNLNGKKTNKKQYTLCDYLKVIQVNKSTVCYIHLHQIRNWDECYVE